MRVTVRDGDTLSHLALRHLGDVGRWPEIYRANEVAIVAEQQRYEARRARRMSGPHWIFPGTTIEITGQPHTAQHQR